MTIVITLAGLAIALGLIGGLTLAVVGLLAPTGRSRRGTLVRGGRLRAARRFIVGDAVMNDDLTNRGPADRKRISLTEAWEVRYWTKALGAEPALVRPDHLAAADAPNEIGWLWRARHRRRLSF